MDFFEHQDAAKARTGKLVVLYVVCLLGVVLMLNAVAYVVVRIADANRASDRRNAAPRAMLDEKSPILGNLPFFGIVSAITLVFIGGASLVKAAQIGSSGVNIAQQLGGVPLSQQQGGEDETMLRNIVEEMAIASGVPAPQVFVLPDEGAINAFAAGTKPQNAVIGVTRGAIAKLSRDQLQGVIAHEFSHILNLDTRINMRLIALNFGLMALAVVGYQMLRFSPRSSGSRNEKGGGVAVYFVIAIGLIVIGGIGLFFGRILQAAISRQREYLADASAVQFTRNPSGIGGALMVIRGTAMGSELGERATPELSHLFFASGISGFFGGLFATHPPLEKRIRAIDPSLLSMQIVQRERGYDAARSSPIAPVNASAFADAGFSRATPPPLPTTSQQLRSRMPSPSTATIDYAQSVLAKLPRDLQLAAHEAYDARAIVLASLISHEQAAMQLSQMEQMERGLGAEVRKYLQPLQALPGEAWLPLIEIACPALASLSPTQQTHFAAMCRGLINADRRVTPFEAAALGLVASVLPDAQTPADFFGIGGMREPLAIAIYVLAAESSADTGSAFAAAMRQLGVEAAPPGDRARDQFGAALQMLQRSSKSIRRRFVEAAMTAVTFDGQITLGEAELLRTIFAAMSLPMPPVFVGGGRVSMLEQSLAFDPAADVEAFIKALPARWCVYSLHDQSGKPVQVLCVKNLRASVRNRLVLEAGEMPSRRVDLSSIVREVRWRRVTSNFEMDLVYLHSVRESFPNHWRGLVGGREPSFVRVDASEKFPRFTQIELPGSSGRTFGPFADNAKANKFIEHAQDAFDLCRYHNILVHAPGGRACAYKDIGRCDAPCDGSQTMENYRARVQLAADQLGEVSKAIDADTASMKAAAANLDFEAAGRLKRRVDSLAKLASVAKHAGDAADFAFAVLQPAGVKHAAKLYFIDTHRIVELLGVSDVDDIAVGMLHEIHAAAATNPLDTYQLELVLRHQPAAKGGVWIPMRELNAASLRAALKKILKQSEAGEAEPEEGLLRESPSGVG